MSEIRGRRSVGALGRALFELQSSFRCGRRVLDVPAKEELLRHVPSRSFGSFLGETFSNHNGAVSFIALKPASKARQEQSGRIKGRWRNAKAVRGGSVTWASLALLVVIGVGLILYWEEEKKRQLEEKGAVAKTGPGVGKAAIEGPFNLINQDGKAVLDQYKLELQVLPVSTSIDPERDTVENPRVFERFVSLTGNVEDIRKVAREYRVYYMKSEDEGTDYFVDHSIITYLLDSDMNFVKFFGKNYDADSLADGVITEIKSIREG